MAKSCAISQSNYIPWKGFFDHINSVDEFVLFDSVQYTRRDWRNRNLIKTPVGPKWLTIPVEAKGNYLTSIELITVADSSWAAKHFNALQVNYARAPYFSEYKADIKRLYESMEKEQFLSRINRAFLEYLCSVLGIKTILRNSSEFELVEDRNLRLIHMCKQLGATEYYSGPRAQGYLDEDLFAQHGIGVVWMDYAGYPEYEQLYPPFEHAVSLFDLLFMKGSESHDYMKSFGSVLAKR